MVLILLLSSLPLTAYFPSSASNLLNSLINFSCSLVLILYFSSIKSPVNIIISGFLSLIFFTRFFTSFIKILEP